jgi:anti-repressor protein
MKDDNELPPEGVEGILPFQFNSHGVTAIVDEKGEPWFIAKEVCDILELGNPSQAVSALDDDEKNTIVLTEGIRGNPTKVIVNESGLYCLIIRSDKSQAKPFRRWVTGVVLPSICTTDSISIDMIYNGAANGKG